MNRFNYTILCIVHSDVLWCQTILFRKHFRRIPRIIAGRLLIRLNCLGRFTVGSNQTVSIFKLSKVILNSTEWEITINLHAFDESWMRYALGWDSLRTILKSHCWKFHIHYVKQSLWKDLWSPDKRNGRNYGQNWSPIYVSNIWPLEYVGYFRRVLLWWLAEGRGNSKNCYHSKIISNISKLNSGSIFENLKIKMPDI